MAIIAYWRLQLSESLATVFQITYSLGPLAHKVDALPLDALPWLPGSFFISDTGNQMQQLT